MLLEASGAALESANQIDYQQTLDSARVQTDETTWQMTRTVARAMSLEETITHILSLVRPASATN